MTAEVNHMDKGGKCKRNWRIFPIVTYVQYLLFFLTKTRSSVKKSSCLSRVGNISIYNFYLRKCIFTLQLE